MHYGLRSEYPYLFDLRDFPHIHACDGQNVVYGMEKECSIDDHGSSECEALKCTLSAAIVFCNVIFPAAETSCAVSSGCDRTTKYRSMYS